jgi:hypothetical protein
MKIREHSRILWEHFWENNGPGPANRKTLLRISSRSEIQWFGVMEWWSVFIGLEYGGME